MARIICPNADYTGISASVQFTNGVGETSDPYLITWFRENGYAVEDVGAPKKKSRKAQADEEVSEDDGVSVS